MKEGTRPGRETLFWFAAFVFFGLVLYALQPVLLPFVVGLAVAYFLDPVVDFFEARRVGRAPATFFTLLFFLLALAAGGLFLAPLVYREAADLFDNIPGYFESLRQAMGPYFEFARAKLNEGDGKGVDAAASVGKEALAWLGGLLGGIWRGGLALFNLLGLIFITPLVAYYMLRDWDRIVEKVDSWLPRRHLEEVRAAARDIDNILSGYVRGMALVCLTLAIFYAVALRLIGLDYGVVIGLFAGAISFIPFLGALVGFVLATGMAFVQFSDWVPIALTAGVFVLGQVLEGNVITPKLVGRRVGLHPVWVLFALLAGGALFGFVGVLLAVPVAAVLGVLARFLLRRYRQSGLYQEGGANGARHGDRSGPSGTS